MIEYELTRSKRKSISMRVSNDQRILVRAPLRLPKKDIDSFVLKHSAWIDTQKLRRKNTPTCEQQESMKKEAAILLPQRVEYYSRIMGVNPTGIKITSAETRWGSCSGKNSLCFSYRLMRLPMELIDYIVVHELAHIRVKNHSAAFYREIERFMPDHKTRRFKLKHFV